MRLTHQFWEALKVCVRYDGIKLTRVQTLSRCTCTYIGVSDQQNGVWRHLVSPNWGVRSAEWRVTSLSVTESLAEAGLVCQLYRRACISALWSQTRSHLIGYMIGVHHCFHCVWPDETDHKLIASGGKSSVYTIPLTIELYKQHFAICAHAAVCFNWLQVQNTHQNLCWR